jgi:hypothetical protein
MWYRSLYQRGPGVNDQYKVLKRPQLLTSCMPYMARAHSHCCSRALALVNARSRLTARYRCCPLLSPALCPKHAPGASGLPDCRVSENPGERP